MCSAADYCLALDRCRLSFFCIHKGSLKMSDTSAPLIDVASFQYHPPSIHYATVATHKPQLSPDFMLYPYSFIVTKQRWNNKDYKVWTRGRVSYPLSCNKFVNMSVGDIVLFFFFGCGYFISAAFSWHLPEPIS